MQEAIEWLFLLITTSPELEIVKAIPMVQVEEEALKPPLRLPSIQVLTPI